MAQGHYSDREDKNGFPVRFLPSKSDSRIAVGFLYHCIKTATAYWKRQ